jgi:hypothetical protein
MIKDQPRGHLFTVEQDFAQLFNFTEFGKFGEQANDRRLFTRSHIRSIILNNQSRMNEVREAGPGDSIVG